MGESMRRLPRLLVGLMLGMALVVGLGARVALAVDPTYTISVNGTAVKTDAALNTQCAYTTPKPEGFGQFSDPATATEIVTLGTVSSDGSNWTITFSVSGIGSGTINVNWRDTSEGGYAETLNVSCAQNTPIDAVTVAEKASVDVGKTIALNPTVSPDTATYKNVTYSSDDTNVATVDENGVVTGVKAGEATITVTATNGSEVSTDDKTATCKVTVVQPVESVELNKETTTIEVGATDQLTATVKPDDATNKAVTWSSDNTSVVTVDENGKVTGVKVGEATITAASVDDPTKTAKCKVTVKPAYTATTGVGATWTKGSTDGLSITFTRNAGSGEADTAYTHFKSASVDDNEIEKDKDYSIAEGSIVITLLPAYLNTLPTGEHTLTAQFNDVSESATASFSIAEAQTEPTKDAPNPPQVSNSRGGKLTSTTETVTYTITQEVPAWASSMRTWVDLESVLEFVDGATVTCNGEQVSSAETSIDGQKLTVTIPDVTEYRGKTIQITYPAQLRSNANLSPYLSGNIASVPYQAHTIFDNDESTKVSSAREVVKFSVGNGGSNSSSSGTSTPSTSTTSTLAKTGDATSFTAVAAMAVTGASALVVGRRRKR